MDYKRPGSERQKVFQYCENFLLSYVGPRVVKQNFNLGFGTILFVVNNVTASQSILSPMTHILNLRSLKDLTKRRLEADFNNEFYECISK